MALLLVIALVLKAYSSWYAQPLVKHWSDSGKCYIATDIPDYPSLGLVGRVFEMLSSRYFL